MTIRNIFIVGISTVVLLFSSVSPILAQTPYTFGTNTSNKADLGCSKILSRVTTAIVSEQNIHSRVSSSLQRINVLLQKQGPRFKNKYGQAAYDSLSTYIDTLNNTYAPQVINDISSVSSDLTSDQNMISQGDCGLSHGYFASQMRKTRSDRSKLQTDLKAYRDYLKNTIISYIKGYSPTATPTP